MSADDKQRVAAAYAAASDRFDTLSFWHHFGRRAIERLNLASGMKAIDLCCGTGASAPPAAARVEWEGGVLGVDLSRELIATARRHAAEQGLGNAGASPPRLGWCNRPGLKSRPSIYQSPGPPSTAQAVSPKP